MYPDGFPWLMSAADRARFDDGLQTLARLIPARDGGRGRLALFNAKFKSTKSHTYCKLASPFGTWLLEHAWGMSANCRRTAQRLLYAMSILQDKAYLADDLPALRALVVKALCWSEQCFPPSEADVKLHELLHLVDRIMDLGPGWTTSMWRWEGKWRR